MAVSRKQFGALLSVGLNCFLILLKLVVGVVSGSVGVIASAVDSLIDLVASLLAYFSIYIADTPPDADHPFGHGKFEDFAGLFEAILIIVGAFFILWEAVPRFIYPISHQVEPVAGIVVMLFALVLDFIVSRILFQIARETGSTALLADAHHLGTDVWSSIAVIMGLILVKVTGNTLFDPIMAIVVAALIVFVGIKIMRKVFQHLVDTALPLEEEQRILDVIYQAVPQGEPIEIAALKTRRAGSNRMIVFNLLVSPELTVHKAHAYCDGIEDALEQAFPGSLINIHMEPLKIPETDI